MRSGAAICDPGAMICEGADFLLVPFFPQLVTIGRKCFSVLFFWAVLKLTKGRIRSSSIYAFLMKLPYSGLTGVHMRDCSIHVIDSCFS